MQEIRESKAVVLWYKGTKTGRWTLYTERTKARKAAALHDEIDKSDIISDGFQLNSAQKLPPHVLRALEGYQKA